MYLFSIAVALLWKGLDGMWELWSDWKIAKTAAPTDETRKIRKRMRFYAFCVILGLGYLLFGIISRWLEGSALLEIADPRMLAYGAGLILIGWFLLKRAKSTLLGVLCLLVGLVLVAIGLGLIAFFLGGNVLNLLA